MIGHGWGFSPTVRKPTLVIIIVAILVLSGYSVKLGYVPFKPVNQGGPRSNPLNRLTLAGSSWTGESIDATISVGSQPSAVAYDGTTGYVYVCNYASNNLTVINGLSDTVAIRGIGTGVHPVAVAYDTSNHDVYIANNGSNNVTVLSGASNHVIVSGISVGSEPSGIAYDSSNGYLYVSNFGSNSVSVINGATNSIVASSLHVGSGPRSIAFDSANGFLYTANLLSNNVTVINGASNSIAYRGISVGNAPDSAVFDPMSNYVYVADQGSQEISVISQSTETVIKNLPAGMSPSSVAFDNANGWVYVANGASSNLTTINGTTDEVAVQSLGVGSDPVGMAYDTDSMRVFVTNFGSHNVSAVNGTSFLQEEYFLTSSSTRTQLENVYDDFQNMTEDHYDFASSANVNTTTSTILSAFKTVYLTSQFRELVYSYGCRNFSLAIDGNATDGATLATFSISWNKTGVDENIESWAVSLPSGTIGSPRESTYSGVQLNSRIPADADDPSPNYAGWSWGPYYSGGRSIDNTTYDQGILNMNTTTSVVQMNQPGAGSQCCVGSGDVITANAGAWIGLANGSLGTTLLVQSGYAVNTSSYSYPNDYNLFFNFVDEEDSNDSVNGALYQGINPSLSPGTDLSMSIFDDGVQEAVGCKSAYNMNLGGNPNGSTCNTGVFDAVYTFNNLDLSNDSFYQASVHVPPSASGLPYGLTILEAPVLPEPHCNCIAQIPGFNSAVSFENLYFETNSSDYVPDSHTYGQIWQLTQACGYYPTIVYNPDGCEGSLDENTNQNFYSAGPNNFANITYDNSHYDWCLIGAETATYSC